MKRLHCVRGGRRGDFERLYDGTSHTLRIARDDVVGWLDEHGFDTELQDRAALVLSELATNAVQAAPGNPYGVSVSQPDAQSAVVAVTSRTEYEQPPPREHWRPTSVLAPRGRGLMIVDELADAVDVDVRERDTVVVTATLRSSST